MENPKERASSLVFQIAPTGWQNHDLNLQPVEAIGLRSGGTSGAAGRDGSWRRWACGEGQDWRERKA